MTLDWPKDNPLSLQDICVENFTDNFLLGGKSSIVEFEDLIPNDGLYLSPLLSDRIFQKCMDKNDGSHSIDSLLEMFEGKIRTKLHLVNLKGTEIDDDRVRCLCSHPLLELDLSDCKKLTRQSLPSVTACSKTLRALRLENCEGLFKYTGRLKPKQPRDHFLGAWDGFELPNLQFLSLHGSVGSLKCLKKLQNLRDLDISACSLSHLDIQLLINCTNLTWLSVADVEVRGDETLFYMSLANLKSLTHLDLSQLGHLSPPCDLPNVLHELMRELPRITSLDISGTSLAEVDPRTISHRPFPINLIDTDTTCSITALKGRHLEFLGLFDCTDSPCTRENLPATRVAGDANEEQILLALKTYVGRAKPVSRVLSTLFEMYTGSVFHDHYAVFDGVLKAMEAHLFNSRVQISGCAILHHIVKGEVKDYLTYQQRRRLIEAIIAAMDKHRAEDASCDLYTQMLRDVCLTMDHFDTLHDISSGYKHPVLILLDIVLRSRDDYVKQLCTSLVEKVAWKFSLLDPFIVGITLFKAEIKVIKERVESVVCDEEMKSAWRTLWIVTYKKSAYCEEFIDLGGMALFLKCIKIFSDEPDLIRNTMGVMINVVKVDYLRPRLMCSEYLTAFCDLLPQDSDNPEISYNAAEVLSHIMADVECSWNGISWPTKKFVCSQMWNAIISWDLKSEGLCRSFKPILRLLNAYHSPESQLWACWALCNLTLVYPSGYCNLIESKGGIQMLEQLNSDPRSNTNIRLYAQTTLDTCRKFKGDN